MASDQNDKPFDGRKLSDTICILPFTSLSVHATRHLTRCQMTEQSSGQISDSESAMDLWHGKKLVELREKMIRGEFDEIGCRNCRNKEVKGLRSKRQHWHELNLVKDLWTDPNTFKTLPDNIYHIDIAFSNFCNFKCRMCSGAYSSQWVRDEDALIKMGIAGGSGGVKPKEAARRKEHMRRLSEDEMRAILEKSRHVRRIEILGGEPFINQEFFLFLELCKEYGIGPNTEIMITTNGSSIDKDKLARLSNFKYVNINLSVDGTDKYFEYMRSSGTMKWTALAESALLIKEFCKQRNKINPKACWKLNINGSYQIYNSLNLYDFVSWILETFDWNTDEPIVNSKFRHSWEHRLLFGPRHLSALYISDRLKPLALEQYKKLINDYPLLNSVRENSYLKDIETLLSKDHKLDPIDKESHWNMFCWYTIALDEIRGQSYRVLSPELAEEIENTVSSSGYQNQVEQWKSESLQGNSSE